MEKSSRKRFSAVVLAIILVVLLFVTCFLSRWIVGSQAIQNVYDEIWYSATQNPLYKLTDCDIDRLPMWSVQEVVSPGHWYYEVQRLTEISSYSVSLDHDKTSLIIGGIVRIDKGTSHENRYELLVEARYTPESKTLTFLPLSFYSPETMQPESEFYSPDVMVFVDDQDKVLKALLMHGVLYEDILRYQDSIMQQIVTDWCNYFGDKSRFSAEEPGDFIVDMSSNINQYKPLEGDEELYALTEQEVAHINANSNWKTNIIFWTLLLVKI